MEGWRVRDIGNRKPKQVIPVFGNDLSLSLPRDEGARLLQDVSNQRNIKSWQLLVDDLVEYLHVAPGHLTNEILCQATVVDNNMILSMTKAGMVVPCLVQRRLSIMWRRLGVQPG